MPRPEKVRSFLARVPWMADALVQPLDLLLRTLDREAARFAELAGPRITLGCFARDEPARHREELLLSLLAQSWPHWELFTTAATLTDPRIAVVAASSETAFREEVLARASGERVAFVAADDVLHPQALGVVARQEADVVFTHEARLDPASRRADRFLCKPDLEELMLLRGNVAGRLLAIRRERLLALREDGRVYRERHEGVHDHDVLLRLRAPAAVRVPLCLAYGRAAVHEQAPPARTEALLREHLAARYPAGVTLGRGRALFSVRPALPRPSTLTVIVPFRDQHALTLACLRSLEAQRTSLAVEVVLVDNGSGPDARGAVVDFVNAGRRHAHKVVSDPGAFNFGRINNAAVRAHATGELLLLLNNDVELTAPDTLEVLAAHLLVEPRVAFAGIRLDYPAPLDDGTVVQHGGVEVVDGLASTGAPAIGHARLESEFVADERVALGVTFACAMVRRETWGALGGHDERLLPDGFGDADLCARALERGLVNLYVGTLAGRHHESRSRGRAGEELEATVLAERHAALFQRRRLGRLAFDLQPLWAPRGEAHPLRHVVADRVNDVLRPLLGPAHGRLKRWLAGRTRRR